MVDNGTDLAVVLQSHANYARRSVARPLMAHGRSNAIWVWLAIHPTRPC